MDIIVRPLPSAHLTLEGQGAQGWELGQASLMSLTSYNPRCPLGSQALG